LPLVRLIVYVNNNFDTITRCLHTLIAQDYSNLDIIVVDNGSIDDSNTIATRVLKGHPGIRFVRYDELMDRKYVIQQ